MLGSSTLEVAVGIITVYILVATICSAIREGIEAWLKTRAAYLEHGIRQLLNDPDGTGLAKDFYEHPIIFGLFNDSYKPGENASKPSLLANGKTLPSYITAANFAKTLMDLAARGPKTTDSNTTIGAPVVSLENIRKNVADIKNPQVQRILLHAVDTAQGDINKMQTTLENWFNSGMDRVSGWYKRSTQWILFGIATVVVISLNINTIKIANYLASNETAQNIAVQRATALAKDTTAVDMNYKQAMAALDSMSLPLGWASGAASAYMTDASDTGCWNCFWGPILGWFITILAAMLGAPFWFDMLNKVMVIRSTVKPKEKSADAGSKDTPAPTPAPAAPQQAAAPAPVASTDADEHEDSCGCSMPAITHTPDEELPETKGGVA